MGGMFTLLQKLEKKLEEIWVKNVLFCVQCVFLTKVHQLFKVGTLHFLMFAPLFFMNQCSLQKVQTYEG
jgi:hypothetical protein